MAVDPVALHAARHRPYCMAEETAFPGCNDLCVVLWVGHRCLFCVLDDLFLHLLLIQQSWYHFWRLIYLTASDFFSWKYFKSWTEPLSCYALLQLQERP
jgi:hypothetical protein